MVARRRWPTKVQCKTCRSSARRWDGKVDTRAELRYICIPCIKVLDADGNTVHDARKAIACDPQSSR